MPYQCEKLVFVHVPKTGGGWVRKALAAAGVEGRETGDHPAGHGLLGPENHGFLFGFVRHPLAWARSYWAYKQRVELRPETDHLDRIAGTSTFAEFLLLLACGRPGDVSRRFARFVEGLDFVGRYEFLRRDLEVALQLAGQPHDAEALAAVPRVNASPCTETVPLALACSFMGAEEEGVRRWGYDWVPADLVTECRT